MVFYFILLTIFISSLLSSQTVEAVQMMMRQGAFNEGKKFEGKVTSEVQTTLTQHECAGTLAGPPRIPKLPPQYHDATTNLPAEDGEWEEMYNFQSSSFLFVCQTTGRVCRMPGDVANL